MVAQQMRSPRRPWQKSQERARIDDSRVTGSVLQWRRNFGWIAPDAEVDHPEAYKHNFRIYVNLKDVSSGKSLDVGARVSFAVYCDGDGLGAEEVDVEAEELESPPAGKLAPESAETPPADGEDSGDCGDLKVPPRKRLRSGSGDEEAPPAAAAEEDGLETKVDEEPDERPVVKSKAKGKKGRGRGRGGFAGLGSGPDRSKTTHTGGGSVLSWAMSEMQGWRPAMEDAGLVQLGLDGPLGRHAMLGIFDGHGGAEVSRRAAQDLPGLIVEAASADAGAEPASEGDVEEDGGIAGRAMKAALPAMDVILREAGDGQPGFLPSLGAGKPIPSDVRNLYALMGSTAVVALLECSDSPEVGRPERVVVANIGDSRAILCRGGRAVPLTEDHKPDDPEECARIEKAGGFVGAVGPCMRIDGWGINLSRALGDFHYKARDDLPVSEQKVSVIPDIRCSSITEEDEFLLLACDGVFELYNCQEAVDIVREQLQAEASLSEAVEALVDASCSEDLMMTQGRGSDNVSALVMLLR